MTRQTRRGYSLLELIVSVGIFSLVMLAVTGAYLTLIGLDRQARLGSQLSSSLSFAIDSMSRTMRTGTHYSCNGTVDTDCPAGGTSISFVTSEGIPMAYRLKTDGTIGQCQLGALGDTCNDSSAVALTDSRITIQSLKFFVRGADDTDDLQPQVLFSVSGTMATKQGQIVDFTIQSAATQRAIDL